jgi:hypothetical protein
MENKIKTIGRLCKELAEKFTSKDNSFQIEYALIKRILWEGFGWRDGKFESVEDIYVTSKKGLEEDDVEAEIYFKYLPLHHSGGEISLMEMPSNSILTRLYVAATYEDYTVEMLQEHVRELELSGLTIIETSSGVNLNSSYYAPPVEGYLRVIKQFNPYLRQEVRLWIELNT